MSVASCCAPSDLISVIEYPIHCNVYGESYKTVVDHKLPFHIIFCPCIVCPVTIILCLTQDQLLNLLTSTFLQVFQLLEAGERLSNHCAMPGYAFKCNDTPMTQPAK